MEQKVYLRRKTRFPPIKFIIKEERIAKPIIETGDFATILAIIAGITIMLVTSNAPTILIVDNTAKDRTARKASSRNLTFTPLDSAMSLLKIIKTRPLYEERKNIKTTKRIKNNNLISCALAEIISPTKYLVTLI